MLVVPYFLGLFFRIIFCAFNYFHYLLQELLTQLFDPKTMKEDEEWLSGKGVGKAEDIQSVFCIGIQYMISLMNIHT